MIDGTTGYFLFNHLHAVQLLRSYIAESYLTLYLTVLEHAAIAAALHTKNFPTKAKARTAPSHHAVVQSVDANFTRGHISDNVIATAIASPRRPMTALPLEKLLQERSKLVESAQNSSVVRCVKLALAFALEAITYIGNWYVRPLSIWGLCIHAITTFHFIWLAGHESLSSPSLRSCLASVYRGNFPPRTRNCLVPQR